MKIRFRRNMHLKSVLLARYRQWPFQVHFYVGLRKIETKVVDFDGQISEMTLPVNSFDLSKRDVVNWIIWVLLMVRRVLSLNLLRLYSALFDRSIESNLCRFCTNCTCFRYVLSTQERVNSIYLRLLPCVSGRKKISNLHWHIRI